MTNPNLFADAAPALSALAHPARRLYRARPDGLEALRAAIDAVCTCAVTPAAK